MNFNQTDALFNALEGNDCTIEEVLDILPAAVKRAGYDESYLQQNYDSAHSDIFFCSLIPVMDWMNEVEAEKMQNLMFSLELFDTLWIAIQHAMNVERNKNLQ